MKSSVGKKTNKNSKKARKVAPKCWYTIRYVLLLTIWVFCSVIVSQVVIGLIMGLFVGLDQLNKPVLSGIYSLATYALTLVMVIVIPPRVKEKWFDDAKQKTKKEAEPKNDKQLATSRAKEREQLGLNGLPTWTDIGLSPVAYIISTILALGLIYVFNLFPWFNAEESQATGFNPYMGGGERAIAFLVLVVLAPIVEEIIFRGWLYGRLRARMGIFGSILITSALFGLLHFQWNVGVNVFALSVVACVLREITGTIYAGILTHMIKNGVAFYLLYVIGFG
ncbi:CPBP family intramembrane metalloprotease [Candidatus Saccharibacteria bacterium]|nr:CPBP family intramembrane metalloprotease [Candidatus Saccharibacteria bacterium]